MRLVLIDREPLFSVGLAHALAAQAPGHWLWHGASWAEWLAGPLDAMRAADAVLADAGLLAPGPSPQRQALARWLPGVPLLVMVRHAVQAQAWHAAGEAVIDRTLPVDDFLQRLRQQVRPAGAALGRTDEPAPGPQTVTPRQRQVLSLIARGESNKRIAAALNISERTVKLHVTALFENLGARNRTQVLVQAMQRGLLPLQTGVGRNVLSVAP